MTGRSPDVDAARIPSRGRGRRAAALALALLCALGLLSGVMLRGNDTGHHHRAHAVAACANVGDGHALTTRGDQVALTGAHVAATDGCFATAAASGTATLTAAGAVDSVRTRGPPAGV